MVPLLSPPGNPRLVEGGKEVRGIELEGTAPCEDVEVTQRAVCLQGPPRTWGVRKKSLYSDVIAGRRQLGNPLECERGHRHVIGVGIADPDPQSPRRVCRQGPTFGAQQLFTYKFHWTSIRHPVQ